MRYLIALTLSVYMTFQPAFAALNEVDKTNIFSKNMLKNGGFENGKASWTASAGTFAVTTSSPMVGLQHATWDAAASADTLTSGDITIPAGFFARNGVASCVFTTASGTATHEIQVWDGASVLSEATITSSTNPTRTSVNFIYPSSASLSIRIYANADEPSIAIDDCYLGPAEGYNVSSVSQATLVGHAYYGSTTNCTAWSRTNTAMGDFASDADCPAPTVVSNVGPGTISTTDNNLPQITVTNLPPGVYNIKSIVGVGMSVSNFARMAITDGTTTSSASGFNSTSSTNEAVTISGVFTYTTTQSSVTFKLQAMSASGTVTITNDYYETQFYIYRFPTSSEQAYTPDTTNWRVDANLSGANFGLGSSNQTSYIGMTNSGITLTNNATATTTAQVPCSSTNSPTGTTCSVGDESNGVAFTIPRAGTYEACVEFAHQAAGSGAPVVAAAFQIVETPTNAQTISQEGKSRVSSGIGTASNMFFPHNLCGTFKFDSVGQKVLRLMYEQSITATVATNEIVADGNTSIGQRDIHWTVKPLDQSLPAPVLTNMVTTPESGGVRIASAIISSAGAVSSEEGDWINGSCAVSDTSLYTCALNSGIFSAKPKCQLTTNGADANYTFNTLVDASISSTQVVYRTANASTVKTAFGVVLTCRGSR